MKTGLRVNPGHNNTSLHIDGRYFKTYNEHGTRSEALRIGDLWQRTGTYVVTCYVNETGIPDGPYTLDELRQAVASSVPTTPPATVSEHMRSVVFMVGETRVDMLVPDHVMIRAESRLVDRETERSVGSLSRTMLSVWYVRSENDEGEKYLGTVIVNTPAQWTANVVARSGGVVSKERNVMNVTLGTTYPSPQEALEAIFTYHREAGTIVNG